MTLASHAFKVGAPGFETSPVLTRLDTETTLSSVLTLAFLTLSYNEVMVNANLTLQTEFAVDMTCQNVSTPAKSHEPPSRAHASALMRSQSRSAVSLVSSGPL